MALKVGLVRAAALCRRATPIPDHGIGPDRAGDVFEALLAQIGELNADLAPDMVVGRRRYADAVGLSDTLKPCRNIYVVTKDVMWLDDDVADIDTHAEGNTPVFRISACNFLDAGLEAA